MIRGIINIGSMVVNNVLGNILCIIIFGVVNGFKIFKIWKDLVKF